MVCRVGDVACRWRCAVWRGVVWCGAVKCDAVWRVLYVVPVFVGETADSPRPSLHVTGLYLVFLSLLFFLLLSAFFFVLAAFLFCYFVFSCPTTDNSEDPWPAETEQRILGRASQHGRGDHDSFLTLEKVS